MRRRKLLIGIGAAAAGGSAAFGTEAFTSAQAERNVDVSVAGDRSSFIAIQPLSSNNAGEYVDTEGDGTVELELDGDNGGPGEGVAQDAITQLEDLFRVVNQGSQEVSVYFEDDSDAVTFRVTRSTGTSTTGSNGESLEGADNSVELAVGEQVVVGMTVDTLNNDVSGQLLDSVVLYADANASAPQQNIPEPQYIVDGSGDEPNTFADLSSALGEASSGSVIGVEGAATVTESGSVTVDTADVTITGINGTPEIETPDLSGGANFIEIGSEASGVTVRNLKLEPDNAGGDFPTVLAAKGSDAVLDGIVFDGDQNDPQGNPPITASGENPTIKNLEVIGGVISAGGTGTVTLRNNYINGALTEGIFATSSADFIVENNQVNNHNDQGSNSKEIKLTEPKSVNGETDTAAQIESLLTENSVNSVQVNGDAGTRATPDIVGSGQQFASASEVINPGLKEGEGPVDKSALLALFEDGEYEADEPIEVGRDNAVIEGLDNPELDYVGGYPNDVAIKSTASNVTLSGFQFAFNGNADGEDGEKFSGGNSLVVIEGSDTTVKNVDFTLVEPSSFNTTGGLGFFEADNATGVTVDGITSDVIDADGNTLSGSNTPGGYFVSGARVLRNSTLKGGTRIATSGQTEVTVKNNTIEDPAADSDGILLSGDNEVVEVEDNSIRYELSEVGKNPEAGQTATIKATGGGPSSEVNEQDVSGDAEKAAEVLATSNSDLAGNDGGVAETVILGSGFQELARFPSN